MATSARGTTPSALSPRAPTPVVGAPLIATTPALARGSVRAALAYVQAGQLKGRDNMSNHKNADAIGEILDRSINLTDTQDALGHAVEATYKAAVDLKDALAAGQDVDPAALHQAYGALRAMLDHAVDQASAIGASLAELSITPGSGR